MNIVNKLTIRQLKQNKKRTLVTIIGVIISVAMVMAVSTLGISFMDLMVRQTITTEGQWHVQYKDVNKEQLESIKNDRETKELVITKDRGYAALSDSRNANKPYLFIKDYNAEGFEQFPIELKQGRLPRTAGEFVISEEIAENGKVEYKIGDQLLLEIGKRLPGEGGSTGEELTQYSPLQTLDGQNMETLDIHSAINGTIVGTIKRPSWEPAWAPGYTVIGYIDEKALIADDTADVLTIVRNIDGSIFEHAAQLAQKNGVTDVRFNDGLLRYYGVTDNDDLRKTLYSLTVIIMAVIVVGSVALIYNAFAISVSERSRYLGMLSSVGATAKQKRNSVFFEGAVIGFISIPPGLAAGLSGIGLTFAFINPTLQGAFGITERLQVMVTPWSLLAACAISIVTILISTYLPAKKAAKVSAVDAIRQTMDIKLTGKSVKTSKFVRRLFGLEAEISLKNLKRNKRRYQATVFSLVISIVLFLTVSFFTDNLGKSLLLSQEDVNFDISLYLGESVQTGDHIVESVVALNDVTEYSIQKEVGVSARIRKEAVADEMQELIKNDPNVLAGGEFPYYVQLNVLDEHSLKNYAEDIGADYRQLTDSDHPAGIVIDTISYFDRSAGKYAETKAIYAKAGEFIDLYYPDHSAGDERFLDHLQIVSLTDRPPMGNAAASPGSLTVIISENVLQQLLPGKEVSGFPTYLYLNSSDPIKTQHEIEDLVQKNIFVYNVYQGRQQGEQTILLMSVFTYGFIVLITAISMANIFNTISTSIALRKREFAMLKSVGMTPKSFNKMMNYESIFYGLKALFYGLPISILVMYFIHRSLMYTFRYTFTLPVLSFLYVIVAVFVIVSSAMLYSGSKVKKENIIDALKQEM